MASRTKKTIYLIRHGQTDYNLRGIIQGSGVDSDINETGKKQAQSFFEYYQDIPFDQIYASELKRTQQSVEPFSRIGKAPIIVPEFNEINWGIFEGLESTIERHEIYKRIITSWKQGNFDEVVENGESPLDMINRQRIGLEKLMSKRDEETILICSHGRAMRSFLCLLTGTDLSSMDRFAHSNLCLYILEHTGNMEFKIRTRNSVEHLKVATDLKWS